MMWLALAVFVVIVTALLTVLGRGVLRRRETSGTERMHTLEEEVAFLRSYADVLRARHGDGLRFRWAITPRAGRALFPRFVLQPLLEEAVMHAVETGAMRNEISVRAALSGERGHQKTLVCTVEDGVPTRGPSEAAVRMLRRLLAVQCRRAELRVEAGIEGTRSIVSLHDPAMRDA